MGSGLVVAEPTDNKQAQFAVLDKIGDVFERIRSDFIVELKVSELLAGAIDGLVQVMPELAGDQATLNAKKKLPNLASGKDGLYQGLDLLGDVFEVAFNKRGGDKTPDLLVNAAINGMLSRTDKFGHLTTAAPANNKQNPDAGSTAPPSIEGRLIGSVAYIQIRHFYSQTHAELVKRFDQLKTTSRDDISGMIVDVRDNSGGLLDEVAMVADEFLPKGMIYAMEGRDANAAVKRFAKAGDIAERFSLIVLVNGKTKSGGEIFAAALQDSGRARLLGMSSTGSGTVQTVIPLDHQTKFQLTTGQLIRSSGRPLQDNGLKPDIVVPLRNTEADVQLEAALKVFASDDSSKQGNAKKADTPTPATEQTQAPTEVDRLYALCNRNWEPKTLDARFESCRTLLERFLPNKGKASLTEEGLGLTWASLAYAAYQKEDVSRAENAAEQAVKLRPNYGLAYMVRGWVRHSKGDHEGAVADLSVAEKIDAWLDVYMLRGMALQSLQKYDRALLDLNKAAQMVDDRIEAARQIKIFKSRAETLQELERGNDAILDLKTLAKIEPMNPEWDLRIAKTYLDLGNLGTALEAVNRALDTAPNDREARATRYEIYIKSKDPSPEALDRAIDDLETALAPAKKNTADRREEIRDAFARLTVFQSSADLAELYAQKGDFAKAINLLDAEIVTSPSSGLYVARSRHLIKLNRLTEAEADARKAIELDSKSKGRDDFGSYEALARVLIARGDVQKALNDLAQRSKTLFDEMGLISLLNNDLPSPSSLEQAQARVSMVQEMVTKLPRGDAKTAPGSHLLCHAALALEPYDADKSLGLFVSFQESNPECSFIWQARIHASRRDFDKQLVALDGFLERYPKGFDVMVSRARLYLAMGKTDAALKAADDLEKLDRDNGNAALLRGLVSEAKGDFTQALVIGENLTKNYKWSAGHDLVARSYLALGKLDLAENSARKAVDLGGEENPLYLHTLARIQKAQNKLDDAWLTYIKVINAKRGAELIVAYQKRLQEAGLFKGTLTGVKTPELETAIDACVRKLDCHLDRER